MGEVIPKLRASARGQECTLHLPCCNYNPDTTVLAHIQSPIKGMGNKGDDWHAVFACSACHEMLDQNRTSFNWEFYVLSALRQTQRIWFEMGLMTFPVSEPKWKPPSKTVPRPEHFRR